MFYKNLKFKGITALFALCFFAVSAVVCLIPTAAFAARGDYKTTHAEFIRYSDEIKASVYIGNRRVCENGGVVLVTALYSNGTITEVHRENVSYTEQLEQEITFSFTSENALKSDSAKVFLLDNKNVAPVFETVREKIYDSDINISVEDFIEMQDNIIYYYDSSDAEKRAILDRNYKFTVNGASQTDSIEYIFNSIQQSDGYIKITDNDRNGKYDIIEISVYDYYIVNEVGEDRLTLDGTLCTYDDTTNVEFYNKAGEIITLSEFEDGDVVAICSENYQAQSPRQSLSRKTKIYNLGKSYVTGTVTQISERNRTLGIGDKVYKVTGNIEIGSDKGFSLSSTGTYYIGITGKIFRYYGTNTMNIGYILDAGVMSDAFDNKLIIRMLVSDGSVKDFTVGNGFEYIEDNNGDKNKVTIINGDAGKIYKFENNYKKYGNATAEQRLVEYRVAGNGNLMYALSFDDVYLSDNATYRESSQKIGSSLINDNAVIFAVGEDDAFVASLANLTDGENYDICAASKYDMMYETVVITSANLENPNPEQEQEGKVEYGIIIDSAVTDEVFDDYIECKIFSFDGTVKTVKCAKNFYCKTETDGMTNYIPQTDYGKMNNYVELYKADGAADNVQRYVEYSICDNGEILYTNVCDGAESFIGTYDKNTNTIADKSLDNGAFIYSAPDGCTANCDALIDGYKYSGVVFNIADGKYKNIFIQNGELSEENIAQPVVSEYQYGYIENIGIANIALEEVLAVKMPTNDGIVTMYSGDYLKVNGRRFSANDAFNAVKEYKIVQFNVCDGKLYSINTFADKKSGMADTYKSSTGRLGNCLLGSDTVVYMAETNRGSDIHYKSDISQLIDDSEYDYIAADFNDDNEAGILVITKVYNPVDVTQNTAFVIDTKRTVVDGDEVFEVTVYKDNSDTSVKLIFDDNSEMMGMYDIYEITPGSPILYNVRTDGIVDDYAVLGLVNYGKIDFDNSLLGELTNDSCYYVYGYIDALRKTSKSKTVSLLNSNEDFAVTESTNKYTFKKGSKSSVLYTNDFMATVNVDEYDPDTNEATFVFMKLYDDDVRDICTFDERTYVGGSNRTEYVNTKQG